MNPVRALVLPALALALLLSLPTAVPAPERRAAVWIGPDLRPVDADVAWLGDCNGPGTLVVTLHLAAGPTTHEVPATSVMALDACDAVTRCYECPPVPIPFAWTIQGPSVDLVGGGSAYYETYQNHNLAYSMQGAFLDGTLEWRGVL